MTTATIPLGLYLWRRIREVGIRSVMGLPGDFNLNFLDYIYDVSGLTWTGNGNELNSAYAADGYARVKGVPGCLVTTHGVGELSAINGIAGSAAERNPIIHIVGQTPRNFQDGHMMIHHSIGERPDHQLFNQISKHLRADAAELWDAEKAPAEIDRIIRQCFLKRSPVYIYFPLDLSAEQVPTSLLDTSIDIAPPSDVEREQKVASAILEALYAAKNPAIFIDHLAHSAEAQAREFVFKAMLPTYTSPMGRGIVDEDFKYFAGVYTGGVTGPLTENVRDADFVLAVGWFDSDLNSGMFTRGILPERRIDLKLDQVTIRGENQDGIYMAPLLSLLTATIEPSRIPKVAEPVPRPYPISTDDGTTHISHNYLWEKYKDFARPGDVVIADMGTPCYGILDAEFPPKTKYMAQIYWGSIGWATPCALGAALALRDMHEDDPSQSRGRTLLFTGDGSIQLTIQEVGTMIARGLNPIIFIFNNNGYTIERSIHGAKQKYNDIAPYDWSAMLKLFGAPNAEKQYRKVTTKAEFEDVYKDPTVMNSEEIQVVELVLPTFDIPWRLSKVLAKRPGMAEYLHENGFSNSPKP